MRRFFRPRAELVVAQGRLFLKYEDMKRNLRQAVSEIASFLEADLSNTILDKIAADTTFDEMKKDDSTNLSNKKKFKGQFMRKGAVGDWKNFLTAVQSEEMDSERLKDSGLTFEFE